MNIKDLSEKIVDIEEEALVVEDELVIDVQPLPNFSKTGFYKEMFSEGQLKSTSWWSKGYLNGELYRWDKFGNLEEHAYYRDGKLVKSLFNIDGLQEQRMNKKLVESIRYEDGKINGEYRRYDEGRLIMYGIYKDDVLVEKIEDGREFNSLVEGENDMNDRLNSYVDYDKYNLSFGRFNEDKSEFIVPAFPGKNNVKEIKRIISMLNIFENVIYDSMNYYFFIK